MQTEKLLTAAIAATVLFLGGLTTASALPLAPSQTVAPAGAAADANLIKVRRGYHRSRRHFRRRFFRFGFRRGHARRYYGIRRHRFFGHRFYGFRSRPYYRRYYRYH